MRSFSIAKISSAFREKGMDKREKT